VLAWPVDEPYITQYFGNTAFATQNPQVYGGKGHNAVDLRASPGTPIKAARGGVVKGTGNTDLTCPGASYGKWIFIEHDNGLSTIYAHLSTQLVSQGQTGRGGAGNRVLRHDRLRDRPAPPLWRIRDPPAQR
jgi:murein DD-endopeptidase MepM/ murein hydrolase activator NlpD